MRCVADCSDSIAMSWTLDCGRGHRGQHDPRHHRVLVEHLVDGGRQDEQQPGVTSAVLSTG